MAIGEVVAEVRVERGLTQDELAQRVMVTRQAVSRLLEAPPGPHCQSCGMPIPKEEQRGKKMDGTKSEDYCAWCYQDGAFIGPETLEEAIENSAPYMSEGVHITEDEAISYMSAVLPHLRRWQKR
ncbi:XRE family transcriptional regulator [Actinomyces sp. 432]|uniref:zinc ribbon domain-containing protein n=1 Tax=Actinomyces sp. 432 TaxID=2057798 RepID=UPI001373C5B4|nr:zinc ribbon domain-containing protein [Actinomyces sp. 432]QHO91555.1 XRE family transcriptional regulator [Actinomyces sp. 432]